MNDPSGAVRATALGALARLGDLQPAEVRAGLGDQDPVVRRRSCELAARSGAAFVAALVAATADPDDRVVEAACSALGELGADAARAEPVAALAAVTTDHRDPLCREAAVAALGAIGHPAGRGAILAATTDKPAVRRRAVLALAPFDGPDIDAALQQALTDRDWQVRQAAEDLGATPAT